MRGSTPTIEHAMYLLRKKKFKSLHVSKLSSQTVQVQVFLTLVAKNSKSSARYHS